MTEKDKMLRGELYNARDPQLEAEHKRALELCYKYNNANPLDAEGLDKLVRELVHVDGES
ncbi:MAG: maltose acetyltransferase domain-containing protein, partial [Christensenella sp.]